MATVVRGRPVAARVHSKHGFELVLAHVRHLRNAVRAANAARSVGNVLLLLLLLMLLVMRILLVLWLAIVRRMLIVNLGRG